MTRAISPASARGPASRAHRAHRWLAILVTAFAAAWVATGEARAQDATAPEGAAELLLPTGARSLGLGQATAAVVTGTEALWWNPAGLARLAQPEAAVHHAQTLIFTGDFLAFALPRQPFGVFSVAANLINYGDQPLEDDQGNQIGTFQIRSTVFAAGYATAFGRHVNAGLSYKVLRVHFGSSVASTSAVDLGLQGRRGIAGGELSMGASVRNLGLRLQYKDEQQADPLPTRLDLGLAFSRSLETLAPGLAGVASVDVVTGPRSQALGVRAGTEVGWQGRYFVRAGYTANDAPGTAGPSLGLGAESGRFALDIARVFDAFSAETPPMFFSLRVRF